MIEEWLLTDLSKRNLQLQILATRLLGGLSLKCEKCLKITTVHFLLRFVLCLLRERKTEYQLLSIELDYWEFVTAISPENL